MLRIILTLATLTACPLLRAYERSIEPTVGEDLYAFGVWPENGQIVNHPNYFEFPIPIIDGTITQVVLTWNPGHHESFESPIIRYPQVYIPVLNFYAVGSRSDLPAPADRLPVLGSFANVVPSYLSAPIVVGHTSSELPTENFVLPWALLPITQAEGGIRRVGGLLSNVSPIYEEYFCEDDTVPAYVRLTLAVTPTPEPAPLLLFFPVAWFA